MSRLLVTGCGYRTHHFERLRGHGFEVLHREVIGASDLKAVLPSVDAYLLGGDEHLDADRLALAQRLRFISYVGSDPSAFIDGAAAARRGITVARTGGVIASVVAEHAVGLLVASFRGQFAQNEAVKRGGRWQMPSEMGKSTVGVLGAGAIGGRVAEILVKGFGCRVVYTSRSPKRELEATLQVRRVDREMLFASSDAVVITASSTAGVLVGADEFSRMRPGFVLVNVASARLVDVVALKRALDTRQLVAAFDGYWTEPLPAPESDPHGLLGYPDARFVVTPHSAAKVDGVWDAMLDEAIDHVIGAQAIDRSSRAAPCDRAASSESPAASVPGEAS